MPKIASTLRFSRDRKVDAAASACLDAGFESLILALPFYRSDWETLRAHLPAGKLLGVELFAPLPRTVRPGEPCTLALGELGAEGKRDALKVGAETIRFASANSIPYVFLPPVVLDDPTPEEIRDAPRTDEGQQHLMARRKEEAEARFSAYLSSLDQLLVTADEYQVELAITPTGFLNQLPDAEETLVCIAEFRGAPLCVWPDTAAEALANSWTPDAAFFWERSPDAVSGVTLRDVNEHGGLVLPGQGNFDWPTLAEHFKELAHWCVDPGIDVTEETLATTHTFLANLQEPPEEDQPLFPS